MLKTAQKSAPSMKVWILFRALKTYSLSSIIWWNSEAWLLSMSWPTSNVAAESTWHVVIKMKTNLRKHMVHNLMLIHNLWKKSHNFYSFFFFNFRLGAGLEFSSTSGSTFLDLDFCQIWNAKTATRANFISKLSTLKNMNAWTAIIMNGIQSRSSIIFKISFTTKTQIKISQKQTSS